MTEKRVERCILTNLILISDNPGNEQDKNTKFLLQHRADKVWSGYSFLGGHIEKEEGISGALRREVWEEAHIKLGQIKLSAVKDFYTKTGERYIVFMYRNTGKVSKQIKGSTEGEVGWFTRDEILKLPVVSDFWDMFNLIVADKHSEMFYLPNGRGTTCELD